MAPKQPWRKAVPSLTIAAAASIVVPAIISRLTTRELLTRRQRWHLVLGFAGGILGGYIVTESVMSVYIRQHTPIGDRAPERLIRDGVYGVARNPMTLGMVTLLASESVVLNRRHLLSWAGIVGIVSIIASETIERRELTKAFGDRYLEYRAATPGWLLPLARRPRN